MYIMVLTWWSAEEHQRPLQVEQPSVEAAVELAVGCLEGGAVDTAISLKRRQADDGGFTLANIESCRLLAELKASGYVLPYVSFVQSLNRSYQDLTFIHRHEVR